MGGKRQGAAEWKRSSNFLSYLEFPSSVRREVEVLENIQEEGETAMHGMKKARRQEQTKCG